MTTPQKRWIKLSTPSMVFNAPNVLNKFTMTYPKLVPWDWSAYQITQAVRKDVRHLVFNCHGFPTRPSFAAPHLSLGTVMHPGNADAFDILKTILNLHVIWISACALSSSAEGSNFCAAIARRSISYVVSSVMSVPDWAGRAYHVEDYYYATPVYYNAKGEKITPPEFWAKGAEFGFARV